MSDISNKTIDSCEYEIGVFQRLGNVNAQWIVKRVRFLEGVLAALAEDARNASGLSHEDSLKSALNDLAGDAEAALCKETTS